jgi:hypothetical protein
MTIQPNSTETLLLNGKALQHHGLQFTTVDLKCTLGKRLVSWLHKRFVVFHNDFVKHNIQPISTEKLQPAEWKSSPESWTVVDCVQQQLDTL